MAVIKSKAVRTYFLELDQQEAEELHQNLTAQGDNLDGYPKELQEALDKQLNRAKPGRKSTEAAEESDSAVASETEETVKTGPTGDGDAKVKVQRDRNGNVIGASTATPADAAANAAAQAASKKVSVPVG